MTKKIETSSRTEKKIWRICRYTERFELKEDDRRCRKSALQFVRDFVGYASGNEAVTYHQSLTMLRHVTGEEFCMVYGLYRLLVCEAGKRSRAYRGYLLDVDNKSLTDTKIGRLFGIHPRKITRLLRLLESVGLLDRVDMPKWDLSLDDVPTKRDDSEKTAGAHQQKKRSSQAKNEGNSSGGRRRTAKAGDGAQPFKKRKNDKENRNVNDQRATSGLTASGCNRNNNGNGSETEQQAESRTTTSPATAPPLPAEPLMPQGSDEGGRVLPFARPPDSVESGGQSRAGLDYGKRVYLALRCIWDVNSPEAAREIASFASKHDQIVSSGLSVPIGEGILKR